MIIDIVGTGVTASFYDWPDGHEKWSIGRAFGTYGDKVDIYFGFHDGKIDSIDELKKSGVGYFDKETYPLNEIMKHFQTRYFTNSIAYMMALAIKRKAKQINLWGIDVEAGSEYAYERPCVTYWIGQAEGRGIEVTTSSQLANPIYLYGYEDASPIIHQMEMRKKHAQVMADNTEGRERDQWTGKYVAMRDMINIVRS